MIVQIGETAEADLDVGFDFYKEQSGDAAVGWYFLDTLHSEIDSLRFYGGTHRKHFRHFRYVSRRFPFGIYYDVSGEVIRVIRVLDLRRNPRWIRKQLK